MYYGKIIIPQHWKFYFIYLFKKSFIHLFLEKGSEKERGEKHQCVVASHTPIPTPGDLASNPGMCSRLGIHPVILWFAGQCSTHWATAARTPSSFLVCLLLWTFFKLFLMHSINFGVLCFYFHLSWNIFNFLFLFILWPNGCSKLKRKK